MLLQSDPQTTMVKVPSHFRTADRAQKAWFCDRPSFVKKTSKSRAGGPKRRGLLYEAQVCQYLNKLDENVTGLDHPWIRFMMGDSDILYAQPDWLGINFHRGLIYIVEIKLTHVADAWWQLNKLYRPLVQKLFPGWDIAMVEIASKIRPIELPGEVLVIQKLGHARVDRTSFMKVEYNA